MVRAMLKMMVCAATLTAALPALAQDARQVERRVDKLESELRAVQRKVFPGGDKRYFEPEFQPADPTAAQPVGTPATSPIADLTTRVNALERQLQSLTGQVEQANFKVRQMEEAMAKFRADAEFRLTRLEGGGQPQAATPPVDGAAVIAPTPAPQPAAPAPAPTAATKPPVDAAATAAKPEAADEAAYKAAYANVVAKDNVKAVASLEAFAAKYPKSSRASHALYWLGRTLIAQGEYERAARVFFDNQQKYPTGDRAQESLYWLGDVLVRVERAPQACKVYDLAAKVYAEEMKPVLKPQFANARTAAKCPA